MEKKTSKTIISYMISAVLIVACILGIIMLKNGKKIMDFIKDKSDKDSPVTKDVNNGGEDYDSDYDYGDIETYGKIYNYSALSQDYIKQLLSDEPFEVHYTVKEPIVEYDRNNKKGILIENYGRSKEESDYHECLGAIKVNKRNNVTHPEWAIYGENESSGVAVEDRKIHIGDTFRDYDSKVDWRVDDIKLVDNISDFNYELFHVVLPFVALDIHFPTKMWNDLLETPMYFVLPDYEGREYISKIYIN